MGLFSGIGSFFSGLASGVSKLFSGVGGLLGSIGMKGIAGLASAIAGLAIPGLGLPEFINILGLVSGAVGLLAKALGLNDNEDEPEKTGFKSEVADMKPEDFDNNMAEYNKYLSKYELTEEDKERFESLSEEKKLEYKLLGLGIQIRGVETELSVTNLSECVRDLSRTDMSKEDIAECVQACAKEGVTNMTDVTNYLMDKPTAESKETIGGALTSAIASRYPELSENDIAGKLGDIAESLNAL